MTFTPEQVETQEFLTSVRGYDRVEVKKFLTVIAAQIRANEERIVELERRLATATLGPGATRSDLEDVSRLTSELGRHLSTAARLVEELRQPEPEAVPEPEPEVVPEPEAEAVPEPVVVPEAAPEAVPEPDPQPAVAIDLDPEPEPAPERVVELEPRTPASAPAPPPASSRRSSPPPEWEELLSDPNEDPGAGRSSKTDIN